MSSLLMAGPWLVAAPPPGGRRGRVRAASLRAQRGPGPRRARAAARWAVRFQRCAEAWLDGLGGLH